MDEHLPALCNHCNVLPIESKKRPLCKLCYRELHCAGRLSEYPLINPIDYMAIAVKRHGEQFRDDLHSLFTRNVTLKSIGVKYGISRERIRQIFSLAYGFPYTEAKYRKMHERKALLLQRRLSLSGRVERYPSGSNTHKAAVSELAVAKICKSFGFDVQVNMHGETIDLIINGFNVDVKTSTKPCTYNKREICKYFHFGTKKHQKALVDFFACHVVPYDCFYIIPSSVMKGNCIFIRDIQTGTDKKQYKFKDVYKQYRGAWHLLDRKLSEQSVAI